MKQFEKDRDLTLLLLMVVMVVAVAVGCPQVQVVQVGMVEIIQGMVVEAAILLVILIMTP